MGLSAIHGLRIGDGVVYWWDDSSAGARLMAASSPSDVRTVALPLADRDLAVLDAYPGAGDAMAILYGHPGGDYGVLTTHDAPDGAVVRRPSVVWLADDANVDGSPQRRAMGFFYTVYEHAPNVSAHRLRAMPRRAVQVRFHHAGSSFADDLVALSGLEVDSLVTLDAVGDHNSVLARVESRHGGTYVTLRLAGNRVAVESVDAGVEVTPRTKLALGSRRWWCGSRLGTRRAELIGVPAGSWEGSRGVTVRPPEDMGIAYYWLARGGVVVRCVGRSRESLLWLDDGSTCSEELAVDEHGSVFPEVAATCADPGVAWLRRSRRGGNVVVALELRRDRRVWRLERRVGTATPPATLQAFTVGEARLPLQRTGESGLTVLLPHGGMTALVSAPLERALDGLVYDGEASVARVAARSLRPPHLTGDGWAGHDDLLAAATQAHGEGHRLILVGQSMGAVSATRALLLRPDLFVGVILRFPVVDLIDFPNLGIGWHWIPMLGNPNDDAQGGALRGIDPLHLPRPTVPLPAVLIQVGRYDTRADPRHGRRLHQRIGGHPRVVLKEYSVGHVERFCNAESRRAVADVVAFVRARAVGAGGAEEDSEDG